METAFYLFPKTVGNGSVRCYFTSTGFSFSDLTGLYF